MTGLTFWYEFASTYSYLSAMRIEKLCAERGVSLTWRPFILGPVFARNGWNGSPFNLFPEKGANMWRDMERETERLGLGFRRPERFPQNTLLAARLAVSVQDTPLIAPLTRALFVANFVDGADLSDPDALSAVLRDLGEDPQARLSAAQTQANKDLLRRQTGHAMDKGIYGAPSFFVGDELFWGNDRLDRALDWATG